MKDWEAKSPYDAACLAKLEDGAHLISMTSVDGLLRFGYSLGLSPNSAVLDLCCGYGTVLKIWHQAFGISGVGVDRSEEFLIRGRQRLRDAEIGAIQLLLDDVTRYEDGKKYDVVLCSETIDSIEATLAMGEKFLKPGGVLGYQKVYAKVQDPPRELLDFEGELLPLPRLYERFRGLGYFVAHMASDEAGEWERYITWSARRDLARLRENPDDAKTRKWIEKWYAMYFNYRRPFEGQALFGLVRL